MPAELEYLHCPICRQESLFETPPCADGHGEDCPERLCTDCGAVVALAPEPTPSAATTGALRRARIA
jgi:hypothetical protein